MSTGQVFSGVASFMAGFAVEWLLSARGPAYPNNYAMLFLLGFVMLAFSFIAVALMVEEGPSPVGREPRRRAPIVIARPDVRQSTAALP